MREHVDNLKKVIDMAVVRGMFQNAESVEAVMSSFRKVAAAAMDQSAAIQESKKQMPDGGL